jgi:hypothetical protein
MNAKSIKYELQNVLSGTSGSSHDAVIQAVSDHLRRDERASPMAETKHQNKAKETERLLILRWKITKIINNMLNYLPLLLWAGLIGSIYVLIFNILAS